MSPKQTICTDADQANTVIQPVNCLDPIMYAQTTCLSRTQSQIQIQERTQQPAAVWLRGNKAQDYTLEAVDPASRVRADLQSTPGRVARVCKTCELPFLARARDRRPNAGIYCSRRCACVDKARHANALHPQAGSGNYNFKGWASRNKRVYVDRFRAKYPLKAAAHDAVRNALQRGDLVRPSACERCAAAVPVQSHHEDYSQPLSVDWFCGDCHRARHRELRRHSQDSNQSTSAGHFNSLEVRA